MEQLEGIRLDAFIQEHGPLSQDDAVDIVLQVCAGLEEAHAVALVHRDIKPANLFLARRPNGQFVLKILDFGISKRLLDSVRRGLTDPGKSLGSPSYMSPEQMMNAALVDQRADIWSLGILLFELLTKQCPFVGESLPQVCARVLTAPAPLPSALRPDIDAGLDAVVLRCLEKDPGKRYASVAALAEGIRAFCSKSAPSSALVLTERQPDPVVQPESARASPSLAPVSSPVRPRRSRWTSTTAAIGFLAAGALLAGLGWPYAREHYGVPSFDQLSHARLPWDPVLGPEPLDQPIKRRDFTEPLLFQAASSGASVRSGTSRSAIPVRDVRPVSAHSPAEGRLRAARYESWLRDQNLTRLRTVPATDDSDAVESELSE
jgi:serine/threonine protein kinase